jgi:beta-ribofuranosylaminobenzene 5'-phosphate synthase
MEYSPVHVRASSRLHFGLLSFGNAGWQYGGVGVMVSAPSLQLSIEPWHEFAVGGRNTTLVRRAASTWTRALGRAALPTCRIELHASPPRHAGLGSGTQTACAVVAGLNAYEGGPPLGPRDLEQLTGRGRRSAVGLYGFLVGGLIIEPGRAAHETLSPLLRRMAVPSAWRFVLLRPHGLCGLAGGREQQAFASLPPVDTRVRDRLIREIEQSMMPRLLAGDCDGFGESVYRYGRLAGESFAGVQGGPYHGPHLEALVRELRSLGVAGVGQSSWGPTLYCVVADQSAADRLVGELRTRHTPDALAIATTAADNHGAAVTHHLPPPPDDRPSAPSSPAPSRIANTRPDWEA